MGAKEERDRGKDVGRIKEEENRGNGEVGTKSSVLPLKTQKRGKVPSFSIPV